MRGAGRGFTLIELVVVLAVLGLLLALAAPRYVAVLERGRLTVQQANLASLRDAIDKFHADLGRYPDRLDELVERRYLRSLPLDPLSNVADWLTLPPPAGLPGRVYDVRSAAVDSRAGTDDPVAAPAAGPEDR